MISTRTLLAEYVDSGSEPAFRELVRRYIDLVYSAARRVVEADAHLAEDVTQTVFADLARLAPRISGEATLGGWLHRHTCFVAAKVMRAERRRRHREHLASQMNAIEDHSGEHLERLTPILDDAINQLAAPERLAIVLRFFEQRDLRSIGVALGGSEDAAQKRVARALEKLRLLLMRRGVALSVTALTAALAGQAVSAAPAGLVATVSAVALAGGAVGSGLSLSLLGFMAMTKVKLALGALVVAGLGTALVLEHQAQGRLREENELLRAQLAAARDTPAAADTAAPARSNRGPALTPDDLKELLRLRGEVGLLRKQQKDLDKLAAENRQLRASRPQRPAPKSQPIEQEYYAKESLVFAGYASPEAAFQSSLWGLTRGDFQTGLAGYSPDLRAQLEQRLVAGKTEAQLAAMLQREFEGITGFRILKKQAVSEDETWLTVLSEGRNQTKVAVFKRFDGEWKMAGDRPPPSGEL